MRSDANAAEAEKLRKTMVIRQLQSRDIRDPKVLQAFIKVPRHQFGSFSSLEEAYADNAFPIDCRQTISQPYMVAYMTQALELQPHHKVLEIGTGSGYQTAILAELAGEIHTIERHETLSQEAKQRLQELGYSHIRFYTGDGARGLPEQAPFDRIMVTASAAQLPEVLLHQLSIPQGRMVFPMDLEKGRQMLFQTIRHSEENFETQELGEVRFVPLVTEEA